MISSAILHADFHQRCESIAIRVRHELGLQGYDPLPARQLAAHLHAQLVVPEDLPNLEDEALRQALGANGWQALTVRGVSPLILYNPTCTPVVFESNIMHELAHLLLNHPLERLGKITDKYVTRHYSKRHEYEADYLADCLQLPCVAVQFARQHGMSVAAMGEFFCVSATLIQQRMKDC